GILQSLLRKQYTELVWGVHWTLGKHSFSLFSSSAHCFWWETAFPYTPKWAMSGELWAEEPLVEPGSLPAHLT
uniref:Uncharacterized protein n=1 Tax=Geospiza parvula TaxID=87175 RepID=A0A8C3N8F0_GEOPR